MRHTTVLMIIAFGCSLAFSGGPRHADSQIPLGWGELALTDDQMKRIGDIKSDHKAELANLEKKLKEAISAEQAKLLAVLTAEQKTKLTQINPAQPTIAWAYAVKISEVASAKDWRKPKGDGSNPKGRDAMDAILVFDKQAPLGACTAVVDVARDRKVVLELLPEIDRNTPNSNLTRRFKAYWAPGKDRLDAKDLEGKPVTLYSHGHPAGMDGLSAFVPGKK